MEDISIRFAVMILSDRLLPNSVAFIKEHLFLVHGSVGKHDLACLSWTLLGSFASEYR